MGAPDAMLVSPVGFSFKEGPPPQGPGTRCSRGAGHKNLGTWKPRRGRRGLASVSSQTPASGPQATPPEVPLEQMREAQESEGGGWAGWGCADHPGDGGCSYMLVLIRDWLLAGVSSPWLPSRGGDLTWIWLRRTAARRIMALARRWNSLPMSRDFSKVVLR